MQHYFDIKAIPDPEIIQSVIIANVMQEIHRLLTQYQGNIALSFPCYRKKATVGGIIRLFSDEATLAQMYQQVKLQQNINNYALVTDIQAVPKKLKGYLSYKRKHIKGHSDYQRLKKYHQQHGRWTDDLSHQIATKYGQRCDLPYIYLQSGSTQQKYPLFIEQSIAVKPILGRFNVYGLSVDGATVPNF